MACYKPAHDAYPIVDNRVDKLLLISQGCELLGFLKGDKATPHPYTARAKRLNKGIKHTALRDHLRATRSGAKGRLGGKEGTAAVPSALVGRRWQLVEDPSARSQDARRAPGASAGPHRAPRRACERPCEASRARGPCQMGRARASVLREEQTTRRNDAGNWNAEARETFVSRGVSA